MIDRFDSSITRPNHELDIASPQAPPTAPTPPVALEYQPPPVRLPRSREPDHPLVRPGGLGELYQELVHPRPAFRRERREGPGQVRAVVIARHAYEFTASSPTRWRKTWYVHPW